MHGFAVHLQLSLVSQPNYVFATLPFPYQLEKWQDTTVLVTWL
jgi:hypothetical protein